MKYNESRNKQSTHTEGGDRGSHGPERECESLRLTSIIRHCKVSFAAAATAPGFRSFFLPFYFLFFQELEYEEEHAIVLVQARKCQRRHHLELSPPPLLHPLAGSNLFRRPLLRVHL